MTKLFTVQATVTEDRVYEVEAKSAEEAEELVSALADEANKETEYIVAEIDISNIFAIPAEEEETTN